jgi:inorganic pyrophosphatase
MLFIIEDTLPDISAAQETNIYLIPHTHSDDNDSYDEYVVVTKDDK